MLPQLPPLPANSSFRVDADEFCQPRISWQPVKDYRLRYTLYRVQRNAYCFFWLLVPSVCLSLVFAHADEDFWYWLSGCLCLSLPWLLVGALFHSLTLRAYPGPLGSITLTEAWLRYHPGAKEIENSLGRWNIEAVHVDGEQRLIVTTLDGPVEIGALLPSWDREWLAGVLRDWFDSTRPSEAPLGQDSKSATNEIPQ